MSWWNTNKIKNYCAWGIPFIFALSSLMHFLYDISGKITVIGIIAPVNESVFEHLKMPIVPTFIWWIITYFILKNLIDNGIKWFTAAICSFLITISFVICFYYTYTGMFGINSTLLDIIGLVIGVTLGQTLAFKIYKNVNLKPLHYIIIYFIFIILILLFIIATFDPPQIPLFYDHKNKIYGILK